MSTRYTTRGPVKSTTLPGLYSSTRSWLGAGYPSSRVRVILSGRSVSFSVTV